MRFSRSYMGPGVISTEIAPAKGEPPWTPIESRLLTSYAALVIGLTATALVLRLLFLGRDSLWVDEGATADIVMAAWPRLEALLTSSCSVMALYYLIIHVWISIAGTSEFALRFPSAVFSALTVPVLYMLGVELFDLETGAIAAALMTINVTAIGFGQDARAYALLMLLVTVSALFFVRAVRRPSIANCAGYVTFGALSVYTHLFAVLLLPAEWLSLWFLRPGHKATVRLTVSAVIFGTLAMPAFATAIAHDAGVTSWISPTTPYAVLQLFIVEAGHSQLVHFQGHWRAAYFAVGAMLALAYGAAIVAALWSAASDRRYRNQLCFVALCAFLPVVITILVSVVKPLFIDRYLLECQPFTAMLVAAGLMRTGEAIPKRAVFAISGVIILIALVEISLYYASPEWEDWRGAVSYVARDAEPGDAVIIYRGDARWGVDYYRDRLRDPARFPAIAYPEWDGMFRVDGHFIEGRIFEGMDPYLQQAIEMQHGRVWLILRGTNLSGPNSGIARTAWDSLASRYGAPEVKKFPGVEVALFAPPKARAESIATGTLKVRSQ